MRKGREHEFVGEGQVALPNLLFEKSWEDPASGPGHCRTTC
jgi:hypothetical protein